MEGAAELQCLKDYHKSSVLQRLCHRPASCPSRGGRFVKLPTVYSETAFVLQYGGTDERTRPEDKVVLFLKAP